MNVNVIFESFGDAVFEAFSDRNSSRQITPRFTPPRRMDGSARTDRMMEALACARETASPFAMGKKAKGGGVGGKQRSLLGGFDFTKYPQLKTPLEEIGKTIDVPGNFWDKFPARRRT